MVNLETILSWFQTGDYPTQEEFEQTFSSFRHKDTKIPITEVDGLESSLNSKLSVDDLPSNMALVDEGQPSDVFNKEQIMAMAMMLSDYVKDGKIRADKIEALGLTDLIESNERNIAEFAANSGKYEFQQNDFIAVPDDKGNFSLFIFRGEEKRDTQNYLPTGLTNITMGMVEGLQSALNTKLDKPALNGNYFVKMNGTASYQSINPGSDHLLFWNGSEFKNSNIFRESSGLKYGIGTTTPAEQLHLTSRARMSGLVLENNAETLPQQLTYSSKKFFGTDDAGVKRPLMFADYNALNEAIAGLTATQALSLSHLLNGGAGSAGAMSVNLISPPIIQNQYNTIEYVLLRGANLDLNSNSMSVEILAADKTTLVATIPNNQVQLDSEGLNLIFYYNFHNFPVGQHFIRITSGVKTYITSLDLNVVQSIQNVDLSTITWDYVYANDAAPLLEDIANSGNFTIKTQTGASTTPKTSLKSSELFKQGEDFLLELTINLTAKPQYVAIARSLIGIGYSSTQNSTSIASQISFGYDSPFSAPAINIYNNNRQIDLISTPNQIVITFVKTGNIFRTVIGNSNSLVTISNNQGYSVFAQIVGHDLVSGEFAQVVQGQITKAFKFN